MCRPIVRFLAADLYDYNLLYAEMCAKVTESAEPGPEVSVLKVFISALLQRITEFNAEVALEYGDTVFDLHWQIMMARSVTIFAGAEVPWLGFEIIACI